jgi:hypothetical protein
MAKKFQSQTLCIFYIYKRRARLVQKGKKSPHYQAKKLPQAPRT